MAFFHKYIFFSYDRLGDIMLKKMLYRKIMVASSLLLVIMMLYFIPSYQDEVIVSEKLEYVYPNNEMVIYLLDSDNYVSRTVIPVNQDSTIQIVGDLVEGLLINGKKNNIIPNGFKPLLPINTKVLNITLDNGILMVDFSKEFNNVNEEYEEKLIEALTYTLTSIKGIEKLEIYVDGKKLTMLPNSKKKLPKYLDKSYGINKDYEITSLNDVDNYTVYYVSNNIDESYYIPVTKYINNQEKRDKIEIIIDELATNLIYESNLASYLDMNAKLLDYEIINDQVRVNFNDKILSSITEDKILEEVMYTIGLSLCDELSVSSVVFEVNNQEIATFNLE